MQGEANREDRNQKRMYWPRRAHLRPPVRDGAPERCRARIAHWQSTFCGCFGNGPRRERPSTQHDRGRLTAERGTTGGAGTAATVVAPADPDGGSPVGIAASSAACAVAGHIAWGVALKHSPPRALIGGVNGEGELASATGAAIGGNAARSSPSRSTTRTPVRVTGTVPSRKAQEPRFDPQCGPPPPPSLKHPVGACFRFAQNRELGRPSGADALAVSATAHGGKRLRRVVGRYPIGGDGAGRVQMTNPFAAGQSAAISLALLARRSRQSADRHRSSRSRSQDRRFHPAPRASRSSGSPGPVRAK